LAAPSAYTLDRCLSIEAGTPVLLAPTNRKEEPTRRVSMSYVIDCALNGRLGFSGKAYFFRNDRYVRYDWNANAADPGYPASLSAWNLPGAFQTGVHAALNGEGPYQDRAYFFRGTEYVAYDWSTDVVTGPSHLTAWNLPAPFLSGFGTAINGSLGSGKAYFFKGDRYVRYDWHLNQVDPGYPASVDDWSLPTFFRTALHAALNGEAQFQGKAYFFRGPKYVSYDWAGKQVASPGHLSAWNLPGDL
jgi:hypothetical protein